MRSFLPLAALLPAVLASPFPWGPPSGGGGGGGSGKPPAKGAAAYFLKNTNTSDNQLVSMAIASDGSLGKPVLTSTGGKGAFPISTLATPAGIFFSQSIVTVGGNYLFTVNPGAGTIVMFTINTADPTDVKLVDTKSTNGDFPTSVAYSPDLELVCALNGGSKGSVQCFKVAASGLTRHGKALPLYSGFKQTNPPTGPVDTVTQISFNPASTSLWVIVKGNPVTKPNPTPGKFLEYTISNGVVSSKPKISSISDLIFNFGASWINDETFLISSPVFGVAGGALVDTQGNTPRQVDNITVVGEAAVCWTAYNPLQKNGYLYDAGRTRISVVDGTTGKLLTPIEVHTPGNNGTEGGLYDTAILDNYSYSLADPDGIVVVDLKTSKQSQYFDLTSLGTRENFQGMAVWPTTPLTS